MIFKEIRLIRLLMWILVYLVVVFVLIFAAVVPLVKSYRHTKTLYIRQKSEFGRLSEDHKSVLSRLKNLQEKNRKLIQAFDNRWDRKAFEKMAGRYFKTFSLTAAEGNLSIPHFVIYKFRAQTTMKTPQNFYRFIDELGTMPYVVLIDFPIAFESHGGDIIEGVFRIGVHEESKGEDANRSAQSGDMKR